MSVVALCSLHTAEDAAGMTCYLRVQLRKTCAEVQLNSSSSDGEV